jgi:hypothetical protein
MRFGIDTAQSTLGHARELRKLGVTFVVRYLSTPGNPKNVTRAEIAELFRYGIAVVLVFETTADRALGGARAGQYDGQSAIVQTHALGLEVAPVYFAVDFELTDSGDAPVRAYFTALRLALGSRVGCYGGLVTISKVLTGTGIFRAWQTYAWSFGKWDARAQLRQYSNGHKLAGLDCDFNQAVAKDFGQTEAPLPRRVVAALRYGLRYRQGIPYTEPV